MSKKYKKHLGGRTANLAVCGSHTSAKKFNLQQWLEFSARDRCPKCETVHNMGSSSSTAAAPAG